LFQKDDTFATLYSEYEQYVQVLINFKNKRIITRPTRKPVTSKNFVPNNKVKAPERTAAEVSERLELLEILEKLLEALNAEEMEEFDYKRKYDRKTVIIDKDGAQKEIPEEEAEPRAGAGAGAEPRGVYLGTRSHGRGGSRRRTYKKKRM
jgi:hypothetical protein